MRLQFQFNVIKNICLNCIFVPSYLIVRFGFFGFQMTKLSIPIIIIVAIKAIKAKYLQHHYLLPHRYTPLFC